MSAALDNIRRQFEANEALIDGFRLAGCKAEVIEHRALRLRFITLAARVAAEHGFNRIDAANYVRGT